MQKYVNTLKVPYAHFRVKTFMCSTILLILYHNAAPLFTLCLILLLVSLRPPPLRKPSLLQLVSSHRPKQAPLIRFLPPLWCFYDHSRTVGGNLPQDMKIPLCTTWDLLMRSGGMFFFIFYLESVYLKPGASLYKAQTVPVNGFDNKPHAALVHSYTFYSNGISS